MLAHTQRCVSSSVSFNAAAARWTTEHSVKGHEREREERDDDVDAGERREVEERGHAPSKLWG